MNGNSLLERAVVIFNTGDPFDKARLTLELVRDWETGDVYTLRPAEHNLLVPLHPARPSNLVELHPSRVKAKGNIGMIHSIVHAESYAIDLSWDMLLR